MTGDVGINVLQRKTVQTSGARQSLFSLLVSEANVSTVLFLDRMVLAVNGYLFLDGRRRTALPAFSGFSLLSVQRYLGARSRTEALRDDSVGDRDDRVN